MTSITARLHFHFPFALASQYLSEGLTPISESGPHEMQLTSRIPATNIRLSKEVVVECRPLPEAPEPAWKIHWTPEPGGIYPSFEGTLSAQRSEIDDATVLELAGEYIPPLGAAGEAFDHLMGRKLTSQTAHDVLENLAEAMRAQYALDEAREIFQRVTPAEDSEGNESG